MRMIGPQERPQFDQALRFNTTTNARKMYHETKY